MKWLEKLKIIKEESGETNKSIAEKTGMPQTTVEKLFSGRTKQPRLFMLADIVACMGHDVTELLPEGQGGLPLTRREHDLLDILRQLDSGGRERVFDAAYSELRRVTAQRAARARRFPVVFYDFPVSAGTGEYMDYRTAGVMEFEEEPPHGTNYVLRVSGNSMEPEYSDGDFVFVENAQGLELGEIGIFAARGSVYMKVYDKHGLRSLNPEYKLIPASEDIRCLGRVLGKVTNKEKDNE